MKFVRFEGLLAAFVYVAVVAASRLSNKYHHPNFVAGSTHYYALGGAAPRLSPSVGHHYAAAISDPVHIASKFGHSKTATQIPILRNDYNNDGSGNYHFGFETGNGIKRDESGHFKGAWPAGSLKIAGSYSYTGDDGKLYSINYKADSNGFRAEGDHLPTPPPIPREIQETLHLHQRGGKQRSSATSLVFPASYSNGRHQNGASSSHPSTSKSNVLVPNANYLPPQQNEAYNYGRYH